MAAPWTSAGSKSGSRAYTQSMQVRLSMAARAPRSRARRSAWASRARRSCGAWARPPRRGPPIRSPRSGHVMRRFARSASGRRPGTRHAPRCCACRSPPPAPLRRAPRAPPTPSTTAPPPQGLRAGSLQNSWRAPTPTNSSGGAGQTVAIVDAFDDPAIEEDLAEFDSHYGLAACTTANGCFAKVGQSGSAESCRSPTRPAGRSRSHSTWRPCTRYARTARSCSSRPTNRATRTSPLPWMRRWAWGRRRSPTPTPAPRPGRGRANRPPTAMPAW